MRDMQGILNDVYDADNTALRVSIPGTGDFSPADHNMLGWTYDPAFIQSGTAFAAGVMRMSKVPLRESATVSTIHWALTVVGATLTAGQNHVGLYTPAGTRIATTGIDAAAVGALGLVSTAITPVAVTDPWVWAAWVFNGTTPPTLGRGFSATGAATVVNAGLSVSTARFGTFGAGQTTLPASITPASIAFTAHGGPWAALS